MRHSPFLPTPALPSGRKVRLARSPHFSAFRQPYGLKQNRSVPPALPAAWGSSVKATRSVVQASRCPDPLAALAPSGKALLAESGRCLQVFSTVRTPQAALLVWQLGNPRTRFPWAASFNPSAGSGFKPAANPSPIAGMPAAEHPARRPRRSAPSQSPTWTRPPRSDPARRPLRPIRRENDASGSRRGRDPAAAKGC